MTFHVMTSTRSINIYNIARIINKPFPDPWLLIFLYTFFKFIRESLGDLGVGVSYSKKMTES